MTTIKPIRKVLIANRGEIACRVIKTCKRLDIDTVAVYSDADRQAQHVAQADQSVHIGAAPVADSYLCADRIIAAALKTGADAIHPGYGFLSENAGFAGLCAENGIIFIGPPASAIEAMGSKAEAKKIMHDAGVPLVPGYHGDDQSDALLKQEADNIGYPVLLKASMGGGGKGMRLVDAAGEFQAALEACRREARTAFGDDHILIEKYIIEPRHVEIQVFADQNGNAVYLFERDCSIQRRHQKIVEEAPAPGLSNETRQAMGEAAVRAALAIGYQGAGTIEFLYDARGEFYFMEMNTRLQVEHPVTEMITGEDLVQWQIQVAEGRPLPRQQHQLQVNGHAIETRIYAEAPDNDFLPSTGTIRFLREPEQNAHVRIDTGIVAGDEVTVFYDPMIAKLIAWDSSREHALHRLRKALLGYHIEGLSTNIPFLNNVLGHADFAGTKLSTHFIEHHQDELLPENQGIDDRHFIYAALFQYLEQLADAVKDIESPWQLTTGWQLNRAQQRQFRFIDATPSGNSGEADNTSTVCVELTIEPDRFSARCRNTVTVCAAHLNNNELCVDEDHTLRLGVFRHENRISLFVCGQVIQIQAYSPDFDHQGNADDHQLTAPMHGRIVAVLVAEGEEVTPDTPLAVMEAMKMEHTIKASAAGKIQAIYYQPGDLVDEGAELIHMDFAE